MPDIPDLSPLAGNVPIRVVGGIPCIDVRGLVPPAPMVAVIELIERPGLGGEVIVSFPREPVHLFPELTERGWAWEMMTPQDTGEHRYRLIQSSPGKRR